MIRISVSSFWIACLLAGVRWTNGAAVSAEEPTGTTGTRKSATCCADGLRDARVFAADFESTRPRADATIRFDDPEPMRKSKPISASTIQSVAHEEAGLEIAVRPIRQTAEMEDGPSDPACPPRRLPRTMAAPPATRRLERLSELADRPVMVQTGAELPSPRMQAAHAPDPLRRSPDQLAELQRLRSEAERVRKRSWFSMLRRNHRQPSVSSLSSLPEAAPQDRDRWAFGFDARREGPGDKRTQAVRQASHETSRGSASASAKAAEASNSQSYQRPVRSQRRPQLTLFPSKSLNWRNTTSRVRNRLFKGETDGEQ